MLWDATKLYDYIDHGSLKADCYILNYGTVKQASTFILQVPPRLKARSRSQRAQELKGLRYLPYVDDLTQVVLHKSASTLTDRLFRPRIKLFTHASSLKIEISLKSIKINTYGWEQVPRMPLASIGNEV